MNIKQNARFLLFISLLFIAPLMMGASDLGGAGCLGNLDAFTVGGTLTGLSGTLVLQNNGGDDLTLTSGNEFTFATSLSEGSPYSVTILTQPDGQVCTVTHGTGIVATANITNIEVTCASENETFTLGGSVSGLSGGTVVLQNSDSQEVSVSEDGSFQFPTALAAGSSYEVIVLTNPAGQGCSVSNSSGTLNSNVSDVSVVCSTDTYVVTPSAGANGSISPSTAQSVNNGDSVMFTAIPDSTYHVDEWSVDGSSVQSGGNSYTLSNITADHTVAVSFSIDTYTVSPSAGVNGSISPSTAQSVNNGDDVIFTATPDSAYFVNEWSVDGSPVQSGGDSYTLSSVTADHTVSVSFILEIAYVSSTSDNSVYRCTLNSDASFDTCTGTPSGAQTWEPFETSLATIAGTQYAYVADNGACNINLCSLDSLGEFSSCTNTSGSFVSGCPVGVTLATVDSTIYAYVSTNVSGNFYVCSLASNGSFTGCTLTPSSQTWDPFAVAFATVNGSQYAYVADGINGKIYQCVVDTNDGTLSSCADSPASPPTWTPNGLTFSAVTGTQYAYIAGSSDGLFLCTLDATSGALDSCANTPTSGAPSWNPRGISFGTINGVPHAYVADIGGNMYICGVLGNGNLISCVVTPASGAPGWSPRAVTVQAIE